MPFRLFHDLFPEIAEGETRSICLKDRQGGLPAGWYSFKEMFCDEPGCDCRRAFFWVDASFRAGPEAVIAWGWEDLDFYVAWMKYGDKRDAKDLQGPVLNMGSPETALAPHLLELFRRLLLTDRDYTDRVKRHYWMFRGAIESGAPASGDEDDGPEQGDDASEPWESGEMTNTKNPMSGVCLLCGATLPKAQAARHVAACIKARPTQGGRQVRNLHLRVEGKYNPEYWMHIELAGAETLDHLDAFLRQTWLDCCHHMSCFTINGQRYAYEPYGDSISGRREKSMDVKLYGVIPPGTEFSHEYDYGSTTELKLRMFDAHEAALARASVRILARNQQPEVVCAGCRKPATIVESGWNGLNPDRCFCEACAADKIEDDGMRLPIVNSPRVGVCAYTG